jgi:hypothetical protein
MYHCSMQRHVEGSTDVSLGWGGVGWEGKAGRPGGGGGGGGVLVGEINYY